VLSVPTRTITGLSMIVVLTMVLSAVAPGIAFAIAAVPNPGHESGPDALAASSVTSSNWAGYVARNTSGHATHTVTMSAGTWDQPGVNCSAGKQTDVSTWVGSDGYSTTTVEQTGSSGDCNGGCGIVLRVV
jgi:Peptidase A4 family